MEVGGKEKSRPSSKTTLWSPTEMAFGNENINSIPLYYRACQVFSQYYYKFEMLQQRAAYQLRGNIVHLLGWWQQNKCWIEDALTVFFSGLIVTNLFAVTSRALTAGGNLLQNTRHRVNSTRSSQIL